MAYNFLVQKCGGFDVDALRHSLSKCVLIECFPIEMSASEVTLGISIPFKVMVHPRFESELTQLMRYLVAEHEFNVTDLYTGIQVRQDEVADLAKRISA
jgi:hypothetical protein